MNLKVPLIIIILALFSYMPLIYTPFTVTGSTAAKVIYTLLGFTFRAKDRSVRFFLYPTLLTEQSRSQVGVSKIQRLYRL